ncbi:zinc-binding dehydrogenase [Streptomyces sp. NPDC048002]|uniref:alcohol dehydrogenase catalytic domain-containing protein n=1 Tax=Streptomyces sp. NPDC048002 TaxID=3154344 RepID=UPI0033E252AB
MKAVSITEHGGPEVLRWTDAEDPIPAAGEVVVDVVAGALNRADVMQRRGLYPLRPGWSPYPGLEVSGRVSALGEGVTGRQVGDEVCALLTGGGYTQKVAVPAGQLFKRLSVHGTTLRTRSKADKAAIVAEVQEKVWPLIEDGTVQLVVDRTLPMAEAAEGHRLMEAGGHTGKILLVND